MPITDQQAAVLRALLAGSTAEHLRLHQQLDTRADQMPYAVLVSNAFIEAADRRFGDSPGPDEITEYVADIRSRSGNLQDGLDPAVAERVLLTAVADGNVDDLSAREVRNTQIILLAALAADASLSEPELDIGPLTEQAIIAARALLS